MAAKISSGTVHKVPADLRKTLTAPKIRVAWNDLTPLARNEWLCWVTYPKQVETRKAHIERLREDLLKGKRRPCCWIGCIHRKDKPISPSVQGILRKKS